MNTKVNAIEETVEDGKSIKVIECFSPSTGEKLGDVVARTPAEVQQAVDKAREAQKDWAKSSFNQRRAVLKHIMNHILEHADELCDLIVKDSGKTYENAMMGEVLPICTKIKWTIKNGEKHLKPEKVGAGMFPHKKAHIEYVPLGVVACIIPWNYPLQNIISSLVTPLMAGNAVVLKPSEAVAWSSERFQMITDEALRREGFSTDIVQIVNGFGDTGAALVRSGVDKILFIGSVENGRRIIEGSAEHLTPVIMELGGKDPMIVCDDADLDKAVHSALGGCFINLGQNCIASERILVLEGVYDQFVAKVSDYAKQLRQGVPTNPGAVDVGAITTPMQIKVIDDLVQDAIAKGATVITGGEIKTIGSSNTTFYPPTVLVNVTPEMKITYTEVFGPVMLIMKMASEEEAIQVANSTDFGLHSSVITKDKEKGKRIADQLHAGAACVNDFGLCYLNQDLPFGGVKYSGFGRMNGRDGLRSYTNHKAVLQDRFGFEIPPKLYPVGKHDYESAKLGIRLMFQDGFANKLKTLASLIWVNLKAKFSK
ncbi:MAG: aldehyde dehydrogenase family protein [Pseudomonadales bacterium]|nr:aldehyde dehydrogenase family protein [Pseudomonadales bacterium]